MDSSRKLYRSNADKMIAGVCGGIAEYLQIDSTVIRVIATAILVFTGLFPGGILYLILMFIIPQKPIIG